MKKTKKILITILLYILFISSAYTQSLNSDYRVAIGLRAGETSGVAFKYNISDSKGFELLAGIWSNWLNLTGLYEIKAAAFNVDGMKWYYGGGGRNI